MSKKSLQQTVETEVAALGEDLSVRVKDVLDNARVWQADAEKFIKKNPALCLTGAFFLGYALSKVARHA